MHKCSILYWCIDAAANDMLRYRNKAAMTACRACQMQSQLLLQVPPQQRLSHPLQQQAAPLRVLLWHLTRWRPDWLELPYQSEHVICTLCLVTRYQDCFSCLRQVASEQSGWPESAGMHLHH